MTEPFVIHCARYRSSFHVPTKQRRCEHHKVFWGLDVVIVPWIDGWVLLPENAKLR